MSTVPVFVQIGGFIVTIAVLIWNASRIQAKSEHGVNATIAVMQERVAIHAQKIAVLETTQATASTTNADLSSRLARIETKLDMMLAPAQAHAGK